MSTSNIWISPFIEDCLSSYQTVGKDRRDENLPWEDDGSNIRFPSAFDRLALINNWNERTDVLIANLTDSNTQIDAILSRESLRNYSETYPEQPLSRDGCRGYFIGLTEFELVYEYSTGKPKVHLYVKRFSIVWERGKVKSPPQGKLAWKKPALATLIKRVYALIREQQAEEQTKAVVGSNHIDVPPDQAANGHSDFTVHSHLLSQLPSYPFPAEASDGSDHDAAPSNKLLERLALPKSPGKRQLNRQKSMSTHSLDHLPASKVSVPPRSATAAPTSGDERRLPTSKASGSGRIENVPTGDNDRQSPVPEAARPPSTASHITPGDNERQPPVSGASGTPRTASLTHIDDNDSQGPSGMQRANPVAGVITSMEEERPCGAQSNGEQQHFENAAGKVTPRSSPRPSSPKPVAERTDSPYSPEKQLNAQLETTHNVTLRREDPQKDTNASIVDPWEGMTQIASVDVTVPQDQEELFQQSNQAWYPPPVGQTTISGHVPPALLDEWNRIAHQRNQKAVNSMPDSCTDGQVTDSGTPETETNAESEGEAIDWSQSPHRTQSCDVILPADSPVGGRSPSPRALRVMSHRTREDQRKAPDVKYPNREREDNLAARIDRDVDSATRLVPEAEANEQPAEVPAANLARRDGDEHETGGSNSNAVIGMAVSVGQGLDSNIHQSPKPENKERTDEAVPVDMARGEDTGRESDADSSDSEMSISIPQPLTGSTEQMSSQLGAEVSSSGPPLPLATTQHIQVVETPSAFLNKSRPALPEPNGSTPGAHNMNSSEADKSSQSRILNTYASHEGDTRKGPSQESSKSLPSSQPVNSNRVHVVGTPMSSGALKTQDPTSWSQSNSLWTSSGPKSSEQNAFLAPASYPSQSSNAFSSYREVPPSSMLSVEDERRSPSIQSSSRGTPIRRFRNFPLKRYASEMEADNGNESPAKRSKIDCKPLLSDLEHGLDQRIISRRQSYIINSAQSMEAAQVYQKFRNDYPMYAGDFRHFTNLCHRLQSVRESGSLQRSFLWDDFVIKHLEIYPAYLEECLANETKALKYEEYFSAFCSRPTFKKRSLTVEGISACAAQVITIDGTTTATSSGRTTDPATSFTGSLRDQLSNFHTYSFAETQDGPNQDYQSEPAQGGQHEIAGGDTDSESVHSQTSIPDSEPVRAADRAYNLEETRLGLAAENPIPEKEPVAALAQEDEDTDEEMEDVDATAHETASLELGDEESPAPAAVHGPVMSQDNIVYEPEIQESAPLQVKPLVRPDIETDGPASDAEAEADVETLWESEEDDDEEEDEDEDENDNPDPGFEPMSEEGGDEDSNPVRIPAVEPERDFGLETQEHRIPEPDSKEEQSEDTENEDEDEDEGVEWEATPPKSRKNPNPLANPASDPTIDPSPSPRPPPSAAPETETTLPKPKPKPNPHRKPKRLPSSTDPLTSSDYDSDGDENWFIALRHHPLFNTAKEPSWSDDPNTPFKKWARADANVLAVRNQRGGAFMPVDDQGVIQPFELGREIGAERARNGDSDGDGR
ncbi:hypothetical protein BJX61DRAFT_538611 [Aspergillus egyptiacus]|nr:hypothetical protein BJX61DRAFT_538611 [Aspergillus egyptiacus]